MSDEESTKMQKESGIILWGKRGPEFFPICSKIGSGLKNTEMSANMNTCNNPAMSVSSHCYWDGCDRCLLSVNLNDPEESVNRSTCFFHDKTSAMNLNMHCAQHYD